MYKEAFNKIKKSTGIQSISEMVEEFVRSEDQNFALFNQINDLHREIETLEVSNTKKRAQVEKMKQSGSASEMNKSKIFQNLQGQIDRAERQQAAYKAQYDEAVGIIDKLKPSLMSLFREAGCDQGAGALGAQLREQGPTDVNLLQFLGVIEQRVQEMAQLYKIKHGITLQGGITTDSAPPTPMSKRRHRPNATPRLPATGDLSADSDSDDMDSVGQTRPISIAQFRKRAKAKMEQQTRERSLPPMGSL